MSKNNPTPRPKAITKPAAKRNPIPPKPFKKGYDPRRNMAGRPKNGASIPETLRAIGAQELPADWKTVLQAHGIDATGMTKLQAVMHVVFIQAIQGESWALHFLAERTEGKVADTINLRSADDPVEELSDDELHRIARGEDE
ncbi:MAG: hypothetical protein O3C57_03885 [Verrucomicrobia bacterium]|nr:hypothetical protein [Verrucomicrobiota bacterium]